MQNRISRAPLTIAVASLALLPLAGCNGILGSVDISVVAWEANLTPSTEAPTGTAAALSQSGRTQASIQISGGLQTGGIYRWRIRNGSCSSPGSVIGGVAQYPELDLDAGSSVSADAILSDPMPAGQSYNVVLLRAADDAEVACGQMRRV